MSGNEQARAEIASFLLAMDSYPDRFAQDPRITFEDHHSRLMQAIQQEPRRPS